MYTAIENAKIYQTEPLNSSSNSKNDSSHAPLSLYAKLFGQFQTSQYQEIWDNAPESIPTKIVLPWHKRCKEYSIIDFHPSLVGNRISYNDMSEVTESLKSIKSYDTESLIKSQIFSRNL